MIIRHRNCPMLSPLTTIMMLCASVYTAMYCISSNLKFDARAFKHSRVMVKKWIGYSIGWLSVTLTWLSNFKSVSFRVFAEMPTEEGSNAIKFIISRAILNLNSVRGVRILPSNFKFELEHEKGNSTVPACYMWLLVLHQQVHRRSYPSLYAFLSPFPTGSVLSIASSSVVRTLQQPHHHPSDPFPSTRKRSLAR